MPDNGNGELVLDQDKDCKRRERPRADCARLAERGQGSSTVMGCRKGRLMV